MIAYLIHCSLVWLLALLVYEIWLRRTTFHSANRWYLNASLALGLLLPLYQPPVTRPDVVPVLEQPLRQLALRQQHIEVIGQNAANDFHLQTLLLIVALVGATLQLLRLVREGVVLMGWRRQAARKDLFGYNVFVTGAKHGPFSAFGDIYLSDAATYTEDELRFILAHERAHVQLGHSVDKSIVLLLRCILWWHPLVYIFYSRLSLVQEFQADQPLKRQAPAYSRFLIDESMAVDGVSITHQFFHSPLKTRIRMLQRFATRNWQKAGYIAALTLLAGGSFLWTNKSLAHKEQRDGNIVTFNGNKFELGIPEYQVGDGRKVNGTVQMQLPMTGDTYRNSPSTGSPGKRGVIIASNARLAEIPLKMNGMPIYQKPALDKQASLPDGSNVEKTLIESYMPTLSKLPDGRYGLNLSMLIADAEGRIVYYQGGEVDWYIAIKPGAGGLSIREQLAQADKEHKEHAISNALQEDLHKEFEAGLESMHLKPAEKNGQPVIGYVESRNATTVYIAEVKNGRVAAVNPYAP